MRVKKWIIPVVAAGVAVVGAVSIFLLAGLAGEAQSDIYQDYIKLKKNAKETSLVVTENDQQIGTYPLAQLGILEDTLEAVDAGFGDYERMPWEDFSKVNVFRKISWFLQKKTRTEQVQAVTADIDLTRTMNDLLKQPREAAKDACIVYEEGAFRVEQEVAGTVLDEAEVKNVLTQTAGTLAVTLQEPATASVELTEHNSYLLPQ